MMKQDGGFATRRGMGALVLAALALTGCGCGGTAGSTSGAGSSRTPQEEIALLEANGELPVLEREPTLGGIDANTNGVRDDIERHIEKKYSEPAQRKAAMQTARALQHTLLVDKNDVQALDRVSEMGMRAVNCRSLVFPGLERFKEAYQMSQEIEAMTANTKMRLLEYLAYNKAVSGTVSRLPKGDTCEQ